MWSGGVAVCIFPEGAPSRGRRVRAHRGVVRLIRASPNAQVVLAAVIDSTDLARFPRRPRVHVELFRPTDATREPGDDLAALATGLLEEIRERVPPVATGRRPTDPEASPRAR